MASPISRDAVLRELNEANGNCSHRHIVDALSACSRERPIVLTRDSLEQMALRLRLSKGLSGAHDASTSPIQTSKADESSPSNGPTPRLQSMPAAEERLVKLFLDTVLPPCTLSPSDVKTLGEGANETIKVNQPSCQLGNEESEASTEKDTSADASSAKLREDDEKQGDEEKQSEDEDQKQSMEDNQSQSTLDDLNNIELDQRLLNPMLQPLSTFNPAMYQTLLGHPLVAGKVSLHTLTYSYHMLFINTLTLFSMCVAKGKNYAAKRKDKSLKFKTYR